MSANDGCREIGDAKGGGGGRWVAGGGGTDILKKATEKINVVNY